MRRNTRPIAASDYWLKDGLRRFLIQDTFNGVTINRNREGQSDPLQPVRNIVEAGTADGILFARIEPEDPRVRGEQVAAFHARPARASSHSTATHPSVSSATAVEALDSDVSQRLSRIQPCRSRSGGT